MAIDGQTKLHLTAAVRDLTTERGRTKSICPSEAARRVAAENGVPDNWRWMMKPLRSIAQEMARAGEIVILRKGKPIAPEDLRGVVRLAVADYKGGQDRGDPDDKPAWRGSVSIGPSKS